MRPLAPVLRLYRMPHPPSSPLPAIFALLPLLCAVGCASPGQPRPPSLHIPAPVTALHAERIGPTVHLTWSTPASSTDGQGLRGPVTAVVCRDPHPTAHAATHPVADCKRISSIAVTPGASSVDDVLPAALLTGPPVLLAYRIQLFNSASRAAAPSAPAYTASGAAPSALGPLQVTAARLGAIITWSPTTDPAPVELHRTTLSSAPGANAGLPTSPLPRPTPGSPSHASAQTDVMLRAQPVASDVPAEDLGGLRDPGVRAGDTYRYIAQRVRAIIFPSPAGGSPLTVDMRGLPSPPAEITFRDVFPPRTPAGLVSIANAGDPASTPVIPASVDLSWEPGLEPDLLGYNVYRAESASGNFVRLNPAPLPGPAYRDLDVHPGRTYFYRITAVDRTGNESSRSAPFQQIVPRP